MVSSVDSGDTSVRARAEMQSRGTWMHLVPVNRLTINKLSRVCCQCLPRPLRTHVQAPSR